MKAAAILNFGKYAFLTLQLRSMSDFQNLRQNGVSNSEGMAEDFRKSRWRRPPSEYICSFTKTVAFYVRLLVFQ